MITTLKRILSGIVCVSVLLGLLSTAVFAAWPVTMYSLTWDDDRNQVAKLTTYLENSTYGSPSIDSTYQGYPVTIIGTGAIQNDDTDVDNYSEIVIDVPASINTIETKILSGPFWTVTMRFSGDAPAFAENALRGGGAAMIYIYYPVDNPTWNAVVGRQYGGRVKWYPTCNTHSYVDGVCTVCGDGCSHSYDEGTVFIEPTCSEHGAIRYSCTKCAYYYSTVQYTDVPHSYDEGVLSEGFSCDKGGTKTYTCTVCGETKTETITAHSYARGVWITKNTCTEDGQKSYTCNNCGHVKYVTFAATGHNFVDGTCEYCGEAQSAILTGTISAPGEATVRLYIDGEEAPAYTATVNDGTYRFEGVAPGEYTLRIECEGAVTKEYTVTIALSENVQDAEISRIGDVNGDGQVNIGDVVSIYAHVKGNTQPEGYEGQCADLNGDGIVNIGDVASAYAASKN